MDASQNSSVFGEIQFSSDSRMDDRTWRPTTTTLTHRRTNIPINEPSWALCWKGGKFNSVWIFVRTIIFPDFWIGEWVWRNHDRKELLLTDGLGNSWAAYSFFRPKLWAHPGFSSIFFPAESDSTISFPNRDIYLETLPKFVVNKFKLKNGTSVPPTNARNVVFSLLKCIRAHSLWRSMWRYWPVDHPRKCG